MEWAHAIAPGATILLVVARSSRLGDLLGAISSAVSQGARQISMSWGVSEFASETSYDSSFNVPGVTFTAASGDSGAGVDWPAASPYVTAVGGTSPSTAFHDIESGNNGSFAAGSGYDLVTGLGSPVANTLIPALISFP